MNTTDIIGKGLDAIPTPALVVDREALDRNLRRMADHFAHCDADFGRRVAEGIGLPVPAAAG